METKTCITCKQSKSIDNFALRSRSTNVHRSSCKECYNNKKRANYKSNLTIRLEYKKKSQSRRREIKKWFKDIKSQYRCVKCGESHPACIDFHHLDPTTKVAEVSSMVLMTQSKEAILSEIAKCVPICSNCHRKLHYNSVDYG